MRPRKLWSSHKNDIQLPRQLESNFALTTVSAILLSLFLVISYPLYFNTGYEFHIIQSLQVNRSRGHSHLAVNMDVIDSSPCSALKRNMLFTTRRRHVEYPIAGVTIKCVSADPGHSSLKHHLCGMIDFPLVLR